MARDMKGMKPSEYNEVLGFIYKYHRFGRYLHDDELAEAKKLYPNLDQFGFNIKYVDNCFDSRFGDIWSVSFRGINKVTFHTNTDLELPYETLFDWIKAYLKKEWIPTKKERESIDSEEGKEKINNTVDSDGIMLFIDNDEKILLRDGLASAIAICDWDNYKKDEYDHPDEQINDYYRLIEKINKAPSV